MESKLLRISEKIIVLENKPREINHMRQEINDLELKLRQQKNYMESSEIKWTLSSCFNLC